MKKVELLAPAGNMDALKYAIEAGCDAVYLGGKSFGARAFSTNFTSEEIVDAIKYAHLYGVKVYVTCNTLIYENEVPEFINYVKFLHKNNVDAVLIQDLGMLDLVRKTLPNLEVHASTQMHIHNLDSAKFALNMGIKRVVLARETPIEVIEEIKKNTNLEVEVFVHGSLCISYSGLCLMSYFNGGRSGNRGACAGTCRLPYDVVDNDKVLNKDNKYPLSCKDLNSLENIGKLIDIGVDSLKIEGRMKSKEYVYCVTKLYRNAIDSYYETGMVNIDNNLLHDLMKIFNRDYTKGFLFNESNDNFIKGDKPNHKGVLIGTVLDYYKGNCKIKLSDDLYFGDGLRIESSNDIGVIVNEIYLNKVLVKEAHRDDIVSIKVRSDVIKGSKVLLTSSNHLNKVIEDNIKNNPRKVSVDFEIKALVDKKLSIIVSDGINKVIKDSIILEKASNNITSKDTLLEKISKLGNTVYKVNSCKIEISDDVFVPMSIFNNLKKECLLELDYLRYGKSNYIESNYSISVPNFDIVHEKSVLLSDIKDINNYNNYDYIYCNEYHDGVITRINRVTNKYRDYNSYVLVGDVGGLNYYKYIDGDVSLNVVNSYTVGYLHSIGVRRVCLSYELDYNKIKDIIDNYKKRYNSNPNIEVIVYGYPEIMISKYSLLDKYKKDKLNLIDKVGNKYIVKKYDDSMIIYSYKLIDNRNIDYYKIGVNCCRYNL